jgi:hypothetical protein
MHPFFGCIDGQFDAKAAISGYLSMLCTTVGKFDCVPHGRPMEAYPANVCTVDLG